MLLIIALDIREAVTPKVIIIALVLVIIIIIVLVINKSKTFI